MLLLTHASYEGLPLSPERAEGAVDVYQNIRNPLIMRTREEIARVFEGYDMVEPGLVPTSQWRPDTAPEAEDPYAFPGFAGVGRRPRAGRGAGGGPGRGGARRAGAGRSTR